MKHHETLYSWITWTRSSQITTPHRGLAFTSPYLTHAISVPRDFPSLSRSRSRRLAIDEVVAPRRVRRLQHRLDAILRVPTRSVRSPFRGGGQRRFQEMI